MECLSEFELKSWQAACEAHKLHSDTLFMEWNEEKRPDMDGVDFHWTTRSDGCRYEYWSSAPGDNEYGVLVRVDANTMTAIGSGSDDGIELFEEIGTNECRNSGTLTLVDPFRTSDVVKELIREGWPRPACWKEESDYDSDDDEDNEESDDDADKGDDYVRRIGSDLPLQFPAELGGTSLDDGSPLRRALRHAGS